MNEKQVDGVLGIWGQLVGVGSFITGNGISSLESTIRDNYVGYNVTDVDAEIQAGYPPANVVAAIGRFGTQAAEDALSQQDEWPSWARDDYVIENHAGITIHSWGDGLAVHLDSLLSPPHMDELGRARPLALSEKYLFYTPSVPVVKLMIDASQDRTDSLADVPELALVADGMSDLNAYAATLGYADILGYEDVIDRMLEESDIELTESELKELEEEFEERDQPRLKKFATFGSGLGEDEKGIYVAIVLVHESVENAEENVSLLEHRIESTSSIWTDTAWNQWILDTEIHVEGKVLLAKLYTYDSLSFWYGWVLSRDILLFYEQE